MNYENEIEDLILNELKYKYGLRNNETIYRYLYLKFKLLNIINKTKDYFKEDIKFMNFIFELLNINIYRFNQTDIVTVGYENNFINILNNWNFRYTTTITTTNGSMIEFDDYINTTLKEVTYFANKKTKSIKNNSDYNKINAYYRIKELNRLFGINEIKQTRKIQGFEYDVYFEVSLSIEEQLDRYLHSINFNTSSLASITEEEFENYIYKHLNKIEEGLKPVERQFQIDNGRIDILAKDKNGDFVIVELKICNDKHLIWQCIYYPISLRRQIGNNLNIRIITICPQYPEYIETPLRELNNIEMIKYTASISNGKINRVNFQKI